MTAHPRGMAIRKACSKWYQKPLSALSLPVDTLKPSIYLEEL